MEQYEIIILYSYDGSFNNNNAYNIILCNGIRGPRFFEVHIIIILTYSTVLSRLEILSWHTHKTRRNHDAVDTLMTESDDDMRSEIDNNIIIIILLYASERTQSNLKKK